MVSLGVSGIRDPFGLTQEASGAATSGGAKHRVSRFAWLERCLFLFVLPPKGVPR